MALETIQTPPTPVASPHLQGDDKDADTDDLESEKEETEVFKAQIQSRGLPYESGLYNKDPQANAETIYSIAPSEYQKPIALLGDPYFEEMCNPDKYPFGTGGLTAQRQTPLTIRRYFNQRLLHADGRFARDVEYLLAAQYAVESKQVNDQVYIALRQTQGRLFRGEALTAGNIRNQQVINQMIRTNDAYCFLKNVRGTPPYFRKVMYDVLAMIRQLGLPTWFITLSAADMQWPDVLQTIARQYGTNLTDEQVHSMSFEERSKLLRQNPVTAARHFQYRLNTLFNTFLKSPAHPLGELLDYAVRIEFQARGSPHAHAILWIKDTPQLGQGSDAEVCEFIDRYVQCSIPENSDFAKFVTKSQMHRYSSTCRKGGKCRFHYPRPPSPYTMIAREEASQANSEQDVRDGHKALSAVYDLINCTDTLADTLLEDLLTRAGVPMDTYIRALQSSSAGNSIVLNQQLQPRHSTCV